MSLVEELSQRAKPITLKLPPKKRMIWVWALLIVWIGRYVFGDNSNSTETIEPTTSEYTVRRGNIIIGSEAEGTIKWQTTTVLGFDVSGKLKAIYKNIGDQVGVGEAIAEVDDTQLRLDLQKAQNSLGQSQLTYSKNINPLSSAELEQLAKDLELNTISYEQKIISTQKDLLSNEQSISDAKKKLAQLQEDLKLEQSDTTLALKVKELDQAYYQKQQDLYNQMFDTVQKLKEVGRQTDVIMWFSAANEHTHDEYEASLSVKNTSLKYSANNLWSTLDAGLGSFQLQAFSTGETLVAQWQNLVSLTETAKKLASVMVDIMDASVAWASLSESDISSYKNSFNSLLSSASSQNKSISSSLESLKASVISNTSSLETATNSNRDKIRSLQTQIADAQEALAYAEKNYNLKSQDLAQSKQSNSVSYEKSLLDNTVKTNPLTSQEKSLYVMQVESSRISYQEKVNAVKKAKLISPVTGVILSINGNIGQNAGSDFVTIGTRGYTYILVNVDEDTINTIEPGIDVKITPSALSDVTLTGKVYYVADAGNSDNNGVVTFPVYISYNSNDDRIKAAMNVDISFIRKSVQNVLTIPIKAVSPVNNVPTVTLSDGTKRQVITWLSDGKTVEVISWLQEGDKILVTS